MTTDAKDVVIGFCDAWDRSSVEEVLAYLATDIVYQNVPIPAMHGSDEAAKFLIPILRNTIKVEFKLLSIAASGDEVLTERLDRLHFPTGIVDIPLMGIFKIRDGKIAEWRDYADNASVMVAFADAKIDLTKPDLGLS